MPVPVHISPPQLLKKTLPREKPLNLNFFVHLEAVQKAINTIMAYYDLIKLIKLDNICLFINGVVFVSA